jgi:glutamate synthase domain-containing protein 2
MLTSMGNDKPYPHLFDNLLLDACQVTNPSIDPLREPMELRTYIGSKPASVEVESDGEGGVRLAPGAGMTNNIELAVPIMFGGMSYGSVSLNVHKAGSAWIPTT